MELGKLGEREQVQCGVTEIRTLHFRGQLLESVRIPDAPPGRLLPRFL